MIQNVTKCLQKIKGGDNKDILSYWDAILPKCHIIKYEIWTIISAKILMTFFFHRTESYLRQEER